MPKISEAGREILKKWQDMGVEFKQVAHYSNTYLNFKRDAWCYSIPEQPVPEWVTLGDLENMRAKGVQLKVKDVLAWSLYIPAQPIPKKLLEME